MKILSSYWVLQEVFVDPQSAGDFRECNLSLEHSTILERGENNRLRVTVEMEGSLIENGVKVAHIQFVNVTLVEKRGRVTEKRIKKSITEKVIGELLSLLPIYLIKAGIAVKGMRYEV